jgi:hypothetical protein
VLPDATRPPVPPMFKMPPALVGANAGEPLGVVDVGLSLSQQHRGAHVGDVSNGLRPPKRVRKIVGSRSIGTPKPQPAPVRHTSHGRLAVASPCAPLDLTLIKSQ